MPKTEIDYSNTIIYKITCKDINIKDVYVGHTTNFVQRKHAHKQSCINIKSLNYKCKLYEVIRNNGGWNNWIMEIVGFFNCKDHYEARKKEQEYFELLHATLNSIEPMPKPKQKIEKHPPSEKKIIEKRPPSEKKIYYCEVCKVKLQNLKCMEIHNQRKKHIQNQKQILEQNNVINKNNNINIDNNKSHKYHCKTCDYSTSRLNDYIKHNSTAKHQNAMKTGNLELNGIENFTARKIMYECIHCDYNTSHKGDFTKHNSSIKHMKKSQQMEANEQQHKCNICDKEFNTQSGLWKHRKKCSTVHTNISDDQNICKVIADEENKVSITNNIPIGVIMEVIKQSKELQNVLIEQNKELQNKLLEQNAEHHKQLIELAKKPSMVNSNITNNNNNNQFNLNFFLNETCKNAMNIQDFIQSIKLTTHDFETTGRIGFVDGISRIFINELKRLEVERRPLHCTDVKRETVYVKDNDTWEKENQEKKKLKWAINSIAQLNLNQVQQWQQEYPECIENNTKANTKFTEMAMIALGGVGDEQEAKFRDKIMKNVLREIVITKDV